MTTTFQNVFISTDDVLKKDLLLNMLCLLFIYSFGQLFYTYHIIFSFFFTEKRRKNKGSHKSDKKDKIIFNDGSTPTTMKTKNVHGVVGPAEYIQETSPTHSEPVASINQLATSPSSHVAAQKTANQVFSQQQVTPQKLQPQPSQQIALPPTTPQPQQQLQWTPQQQQHFVKQQQHSNSTPNFQQAQFQGTQNTPATPGQFSTSFNTSSTKIERPHSSAALLQERTPHSPAAFKQPSAQQQQKMTLLAQAMSNSQTAVSKKTSNKFSLRFLDYF